MHRQPCLRTDKELRLSLQDCTAIEVTGQDCPWQSLLYGLIVLWLARALDNEACEWTCLDPGNAAFQTLWVSSEHSTTSRWKMGVMDWTLVLLSENSDVEIKSLMQWYFEVEPLGVNKVMRVEPSWIRLVLSPPWELACPISAVWGLKSQQSAN